MQNKIVKLKELAKKIQAAEHKKRGKEIHVNSRIVIDEYHEWRTESEDLFGQFYNITNDHFLIFKSLPRDGNGFALMHSFDQQLPIFNLLIAKIESGEAKPLINKEIEPIKDKKDMPVKTIFVSHSQNDKVIVDAFVDLILHGALSIPIDQIFCTSTEGTKIESGADWRNTIKESLLSSKVTFLVITPNFKESEVCQNEMGAAWVTSAFVLPVIVEPINYRTVGILQEPKQIERLLDEQCLDRIKDKIQEIFEIPMALIKSDRWTAKKKEFLDVVKLHIDNNPFPMPMDRDAFQKVYFDNKAMLKEIFEIKQQNSDLAILIEKLKLAKDKVEVIDIMKDHESDSQYDKFLEITDEIKSQIKQFAPIIRGVIFNDFSSKGIQIDFDSFRREIDEAIANDYITREMEANWDTTNEMQVLYISLHKLNDLINDDLDGSIHDGFEDQFKAPFDINNIKFWQEVFQTTIFI
jgi:hypothetical protein